MFSSIASFATEAKWELGILNKALCRFDNDQGYDSYYGPNDRDENYKNLNKNEKNTLCPQKGGTTSMIQNRYQSEFCPLWLCFKNPKYKTLQAELAVYDERHYNELGGSVILSYNSSFVKIAELFKTTNLPEQSKSVLYNIFKLGNDVQLCFFRHSRFYGLEQYIKRSFFSNVLLYQYPSQGSFVTLEDLINYAQGKTKSDIPYKIELTSQNIYDALYSLGEVTLTLLSNYVTEISTIDADFTIQEKDSVEREALEKFLNQFCRSTKWFLDGEKKRLKALIWSKKKAIVCTMLVTLFVVWDLYNNQQHLISKKRIFFVFYYIGIYNYFGEVMAFMRLRSIERQLGGLLNGENVKK